MKSTNVHGRLVWLFGFASLLTASSIAGCSSGTSASSATGDDGDDPTSHDDRDDDDDHVDRDEDAKDAGRHATSDADAAPVDAGTIAKLESSPPAGYELCDSGTFTADEAAAACSSGSIACGDYAATSGGAWEVWCERGDGGSTTNEWFWVRFDDARITRQFRSKCNPEPSVSVRGSFAARGEAGVESGTSYSNFKVSPGPNIDGRVGTQAATWQTFRANRYDRVTLSLTTSCPTIGAVAFSPFVWMFQR